jgi:hypothetical protein
MTEFHRAAIQGGAGERDDAGCITTVTGGQAADQALPMYQRLLEHLLAAPILDVAAVLGVAADAAHEAIRLQGYDHALDYADRTEELATLAADELAVSSAHGTRGQIHLHRSEFWHAAGDFQTQLNMLTGLDALDALAVVAERAGLAELDDVPGAGGPRACARDIALCRINLSLAENEIGEPQSARNHAEHAEAQLAALPRDPLNTARAQIARVAATITTGIAHDIALRARLLLLAQQARAAFAELGAAHEEERALRVMAALIEPIPAWSAYRSQLRAEAEQRHELVARSQVRTARHTMVADRITTALEAAVSKAAAQRQKPPAAAP